MNMVYVLEQPADRFVALAQAYFDRQKVFAEGAAPTPEYFREVLLLSQPKIKSIEELPAYTSYFFREDLPTTKRRGPRRWARASRRRVCRSCRRCWQRRIFQAMPRSKRR
jgi:hypothetical protein